MNNERIPQEPLYPEIASELETMVKVDQDMREKNLVDDEYWDEEVDKKNTERLQKIVEEIGWPTKSKVGDSGTENAWLLVQHADHDVDFQSKCLDLMKLESKDEIDQRRIAYLEDRVRLNQGKGQLYGTQFADVDGKYGPRPIDDEEHLDERRSGMGMEQMEEYTKLIRNKYRYSKE